MTTSPVTTQPDTTTGASTPGLYRLGVWTARHPLVVMGVWLVLLVGATLSAGYFTSHLTGNANEVSGSDSQRAGQLVDQKFPGLPSETDFVVVHSPALTATDEPFRATVDAALDRYRDSTLVTAATSPYDAPDALVSPDGHTALVPVSLDGSGQERQQAAKPLQDIAKALRTDQVELYLTGSSPLAAADVDQGSADLARAESVGFPAAALVLLVAFGSVVAAGVPLVLGALAVLGALGALGVVSLFMSFDVFAQTAVSMVAIALGIDYSLFVVTRFREELARRPGRTRADRAEAVGRTLDTAGRAVLFSGTTVVVSLAGLWLVRSPKVHAIAGGMTAAVLVMMLVSVTLLPATLGLLGTGLNRLALPWARRSLAQPDPERSMWARLTGVVMRRPVLIATVGTLLLAALALPVFGLRYGVDLGATAVRDSRAGTGYTVLSEAFPPGALTPITVVVSTGQPSLSDAELDAIARFTANAATHPAAAGAVSVTSILDEQLRGHSTNELSLAAQNAGGTLEGILSEDAATSIITVRPQHAADTDQTAGLVRDLRRAAGDILAGVGLTAYVGGAPAEIVDITDESERALPLVIGAVLAASWLLLLFAFRSLVLPFKAIVMNLLTSGAAFGLAVLIFQEGYGASLLGVERTGFIQVVLPLFAFALVFGLSMDYEVFLLSRMREEWHSTGDNARAVRLGITRTARVITAAAGIMVVVFASFLFTRVLEIKQMGFMLGVAVLIDATIVRLLLVPAFMRLLGSWNWWIPQWMDRLLPRTSTPDG